MRHRKQTIIGWLLTVVVLALVGCAHPRQQPTVTLRDGDEIMVAGQLYHIGTPVKLWFDPGGFDAYRTERRFSPFAERSWSRTAEAMRDGEVKFASADQEHTPQRYNLRYESTAEQHYTADELERIRGGGWDLPLLQKTIDQFVLHYDASGTSAQCFHVLHDLRGLSIHFMLDLDGTIYQTLDVKERAWHATKSNDRSIGIEIANIGAYPPSKADEAFRSWYQMDGSSRGLHITVPAGVQGARGATAPALRPRRAEPVSGPIHGVTYEQYDFTPQQYEALIKLTAALCQLFPQITPDAPREPDGSINTRALTDEQWQQFHGILGHCHVQENKIDPGPAMDWEYVLNGVRRSIDRQR